VANVSVVTARKYLEALVKKELVAAAGDNSGKMYALVVWPSELNQEV
jgi:predicted transcriptional regulator